MKLLTQEIRKNLPALYSQEDVKDSMVWAKFFTPDSTWDWYAIEFDQEDLFFGLVRGFDTELGYFALSDLEENCGPMGLKIERDRYWEPRRLSQVREQLSD